MARGPSAAARFARPPEDRDGILHDALLHSLRDDARPGAFDAWLTLARRWQLFTRLRVRPILRTR